MSGATRISLSLSTLKPTNPCAHSRDLSISHRILSVSTSKKLFLPRKSLSFSGKIHYVINEEKFRVSKEGSLQKLDDDALVAVELSPITSESQFDRVIAEAQQLEESVIILWMATWCRKCIYLKPKLEKLAADYHPRLRFYYVDVNTVPHKLVARAGVTKMPTIQVNSVMDILTLDALRLSLVHKLNYAKYAAQPNLFISQPILWKDSKKQDEVIGGHKAYLVINEVRRMIENQSTL